MEHLAFWFFEKVLVKNINTYIHVSKKLRNTYHVNNNSIKIYNQTCKVYT